MKLLAISDTYIPAVYMEQGLKRLESRGIQVEARRWEHPTLVDLQQANLAIEQGGPSAVPLPPDVTRGIDEFQVLVVQFAPVSCELIEAAKRLKLIGVLRGGTENVDMAAAKRRGICVMNTPGRNARAVAECAMGLILGEIRNLARSHGLLKAGRWQRTFPNSDCIPELNERTVGLVGYGAVGRLMAGYLQAFGCRVVAFDPYCQGDPAPAQLVDWETLLRESDVISIHARLTDENYHLIGARQLAMMKPTAVLVNTARSGLVDEEALVEALRARRIMGAALDVFDREPLPADHPLLALDNVTITPHLAGSTMDAFRNSPKLFAGHFERLLDRKGPLPIVGGVEPDYQGLVS
jgi:D-3-phosphoglycerate dehydrogenase